MCLSCKPRDLSSDPHTPCTLVKLDAVACICNPSILQPKKGTGGTSEASEAASLLCSPEDSKEAWSQMRKGGKA